MSDHLNESLAQYRDLSRRLDEKFAEIRARHEARFSCRLGCHSCCKPGLTVNRLEAEAIRAFLSEHPEITGEARALEAANPHQGKRCGFLGAEGACLIYESRPLVCRSHGAPLQVRPEGGEDENVRLRDVCPLNFPGQNLAQLAAGDVLNLDTLNTLLALLLKRAFPGDPSRVQLSLEAILGRP